MQTDGYIPSLTSKQNKNINFSIAAKHTKANPAWQTHTSSAEKAYECTSLPLWLFTVIIKHQQCALSYEETENGSTLCGRGRIA